MLLRRHRDRQVRPSVEKPVANPANEINKEKDARKKRTEKK